MIDISRKNKKVLIIVGAAVGIVMIILSVLIKDKGENTAEVSYYSSELEGKITELISQLDGVGNVSVMVTLDCGSESVYAKNTQVSEERTVSDYALISGDGSDALKLKEIYPRVRGVAVVCSGGENTKIKEKITSLLSSALGIATNRITVCG